MSKTPGTLPKLPRLLVDDPEEVAWALDIARGLAKSKELESALVWLRRAAQSAAIAEADDRAVELAEAATLLGRWLRTHGAGEGQTADGKPRKKTETHLQRQRSSTRTRRIGGLRSGALPSQRPGTGKPVAPRANLAATTTQMMQVQKVPAAAKPKTLAPPKPTTQPPRALQSARKSLAPEAAAGNRSPAALAPAKKAPTAARKSVAPPAAARKSVAPPAAGAARKSVAPAAPRQSVAPAAPGKSVRPAARKSVAPLAPAAHRSSAAPAAVRASAPAAARRSLAPGAAPRTPAAASLGAAPRMPTAASLGAGATSLDGSSNAPAARSSGSAPEQAPALGTGALGSAPSSGRSSMRAPQRTLLFSDVLPTANDPDEALIAEALRSIAPFATLSKGKKLGLNHAAELLRPSSGDEVTVTGLVYLVHGEVQVSAAVSDTSPVTLGRGALLRGQSSLGFPLALRCTAEGEGVVLLRWSVGDLAEALAETPAIDDDLRAESDAVLAACGATLGTFAESIGEEGIRMLLQKMQLKRLGPSEVWVDAGEEMPGVCLIGLGELRSGEQREFGPGDIPFAESALACEPLARSLRAGDKGALLWVGTRAALFELLTSAPTLLESLTQA